jgi:hypothetical protein
MLICAKKQGRCPSNQFNRGKTPLDSDPSPAQSLPREGGGEVAQSGGGRPLGAGDPLLELVSPFFDRQWHAPMQRRCSPGFCAKNSQSTALEPCINRRVPPLSTHTTLGSSHSTSHTSLSSCSFYFLVVLEQGKATLESLAPWKKWLLGYE